MVLFLANQCWTPTFLIFFQFRSFFSVNFANSYSGPASAEPAFSVASSTWSRRLRWTVVRYALGRMERMEPVWQVMRKRVKIAHTSVLERFPRRGWLPRREFRERALPLTRDLSELFLLELEFRRTWSVKQPVAEKLDLCRAASRNWGLLVLR